VRKILLTGLAFVFTIGLAIAGEVSFVKYDSEKKELTVKEDGKDATYKITDETKVKRGDKEAKLENVLKFLGEKAKEGTKFEITVDKDKKTVTELKLAGKK
jgi:hypothetical protein